MSRNAFQLVPPLLVLGAVLLVLGCASDFSSETKRDFYDDPSPPSPRPQHNLWDEFVDLASIRPAVAIHLRYATPNNIAGRPLYYPEMRALLRRPAAEKLAMANRILRDQGYRLVVWDAYRPTETQWDLWRAVPEPDFVGDPRKGSSLHSSGVAVDVTLSDLTGRLVPMPSDFDDFSLRAQAKYQGPHPEVKKNLRALQMAMITAGFEIYKKEWWHFHDSDFDNSDPSYVRSARSLGIPLP